jgi:two-component system, sensor histidine kinase
VMAVADVSLEERTQRELRVAQILAESAARAKTRFLAGASHDMRTPLHGAMSRLQLLTQARLGVREGALASEALASCARLLHHIDDILDCAALEFGSNPFVNASFDLPAALEEALTTIEADAAALGLGLRLDVAGLNAARFVGDERRVRRIALGLAEEALRRRPDYEIVLEAHSDEKGFVLSISAPGAHSGPALAMASESAVDGMQMARALATAMGGAVIERTGQAGRWQCSAYLPLAVDDTPQVAPGQPPRGLDILVVEDTGGNRMVIKLVLEALGHICHLAEDGARGVAAAASRAYDLVLMDLQMPGMDGLEAARRIRKLNTPWARMPIAALTASSSPGIAEDIAEAGMDAYLQKPLDVRKLDETIALLTGPQARARSVEPAELDQIEQKDHKDKADNQGQSGHGQILKLKRTLRP